MTGIITSEFVQTIIEKRNREIHKGDCGRILIVAGSLGMAGAAVLSARGALRAGSGLVQMAIPKEIFPIVQTAIPEATCLEPDFSKLDLGLYHGALIGPGLGKSQKSVDAVCSMLKNFAEPLVLDADALNIIADKNLFKLLRERSKSTDKGKNRQGATIITPHMGEAARLLEQDMDKLGSREEIACQLAQKTGAITLLKGQGTIVATADGKTYTNTTGNPGMATAGSGDVLAGIIAGLVGQRKPTGERISPLEATLCGAFIHGLAGDLGAKDLGEYGLVASDIAKYTAIALKQISG